MADTNIVVRSKSFQDTGNPVLDSTVNLLANWPSEVNPSLDVIRQLHGVVLELYEKEPPRPSRPAAGERPTPQELRLRQ